MLRKRYTLANVRVKTVCLNPGKTLSVPWSRQRHYMSPWVYCVYCVYKSNLALNLCKYFSSPLLLWWGVVCNIISLHPRYCSGVSYVPIFGRNFRYAIDTFHCNTARKCSHIHSPPQAWQFLMSGIPKPYFNSLSSPSKLCNSYNIN